MSDPPSNSEFQARWRAIAEPGWELNQTVFQKFLQKHARGRQVLHCAIPSPRARSLTDFQFPAGWDADKSIVSSLGPIKRPSGLEDWSYQPQIRAVPQGPEFRVLAPEYASLARSPWFQTPSQAAWLGINARHLRYHHALWSELKPKVLRGLHTTLVYVTPQVGFSLTPRIKLDQVFNHFAALSRSAGPAQLFPAEFIFPDANLEGLKRTPAPIFADVLPFVGGTNLPMMDGTPDRWGNFARFEGPDYFYGYPFNRVENHLDDVTLRNWQVGTTVLPNGAAARARQSESFVYATLDSKLKGDLKLDREAFQEAFGLLRGTVTHDGLPFQLPVEMQTSVFAIVLTAWEMELDHAGDLSAYSLKTRHAAIRGYHFYQRLEPYYSNFQRMLCELGKQPGFEVYPLASHLNHSWLGGNLRLSNQRSASETELGAGFMRSYHHQQLDWSMGIINLWNHVDFRKGDNLEQALGFEGVAFHQMRPLLRFDSHLYQRPLKRASFWPDLDPDWLEFDQRFRAQGIPRPAER